MPGIDVLRPPPFLVGRAKRAPPQSDRYEVSMRLCPAGGGSDEGLRRRQSVSGIPTHGALHREGAGGMRGVPLSEGGPACLLALRPNPEIITARHASDKVQRVAERLGPTRESVRRVLPRATSDARTSWPCPLAEHPVGVGRPAGPNVHDHGLKGICHPHRLGLSTLGTQCQVLTSVLRVSEASPASGHNSGSRRRQHDFRLIQDLST